jgi:hypothetical protein
MSFPDFVEPLSSVLKSRLKLFFLILRKIQADGKALQFSDHGFFGLWIQHDWSPCHLNNLGRSGDTRRNKTQLYKPALPMKFIEIYYSGGRFDNCDLGQKSESTSRVAGATSS